jgi:P-type Ca2+ transporter type 2C
MRERPAEAPAYQQAVDQLLKAVGTESGRGLTEEEARKRLDQHGSNELAAERVVPP